MQHKAEAVAKRLGELILHKNKARLSVSNAFSSLFLAFLRNCLCKLLLQFRFATPPAQ
jgi:hypothetical protein